MRTVFATLRNRWMLAALVLVPLAAALVAVPSMLRAQQEPANPADTILTNGKIITVDDTFTIAQAIAIRGDRFVAVGTNEAITAMAGPNTQRIDLQGRAVLPGMIDNHAHFQEEGAYWTEELRLDNVTSRTQMLEMIRQRATEKGPGEWVYTLGGWSYHQFADDDRPITREELDQYAPNNPVLLQFTREQTFLNSRAMEEIGLAARTDAWIGRDASGQPTGVVQPEGAGTVRNAAGFLDELPEDIFESSSMAMLKDLNRVGLTASGGSCQYEDIYRQWQQQGRLGMRFFCFRTATGGGRSTDEVIAAMPSLKYFDGDAWLDHVNWGERLVGVTDNVTDTEATVPQETWNEWGRMAKAAAENAITVFIHTTMPWTIEAQLRQVEAFADDMPVRNLRWAFVHMEGVSADQAARMRDLGMYIGVHPRGVVSGQAYIEDHGDEGRTMPGLKTIQDSGIHWGFGTDAFEVNQYSPFAVMHWAVTGQMVGGKQVMDEPITREQALVAYTRNNAHFFFRENDLGSIEPGKLADLVVIDRDFLTIPANQIQDIQVVTTMVGGKVFYEANAQ